MMTLGKDDASAAAKDDPPLLSSEQVAAKLNVSSRCVLNWLYAGIIPAAVRVGKVIRFREAEVMAALDAASQRAPDASADEETVRLALWLAAPDVAEEPSWLLLRDPTDEQTKQAAGLAAVCHGAMRMLGTREERRHFVNGAIDAVYLGKHLF